MAGPRLVREHFDLAVVAGLYLEVLLKGFVA
jgi:hypothetical protein